MSNWQPIELAPKDGTWIMICNAKDGFNSYEVGRYEPMLWPEYIPVKKDKQVFYWRGFNNFHRATHWMLLPNPPEGKP